jgi:hypothetical protein
MAPRNGSHLARSTLGVHGTITTGLLIAIVVAQADL